MPACIYDALGRADEAVQTERQALNLVIDQDNQGLEKHLESNLEHYEPDAGKLQ